MIGLFLAKKDGDIKWKLSRSSDVKIQRYVDDYLVVLGGTKEDFNADLFDTGMAHF